MSIVLLLLVTGKIIHPTSAEGSGSTVAPTTTTTITTATTKSSTTRRPTTTEISFLEKYNGLGLIVEGPTVEIKRGIENLIVGIVYPAVKDITKINTELIEITKSIRQIQNTPALKTKQNAMRVNSSINLMIEDLSSMQKVFFDLSKFVDSNVVLDPNYDCLLEHVIYDADYVDELRSGVLSFMTKIDTTLTAAQVTAKDSRWDVFVNTVIQLKDYIDQASDELGTRIIELDSMTIGKIPQGLTYLLETKQCVKSGQIGEITINYCTEYEYGVFCQLEINSIVNYQEFTRFEPVNYEGTQIRFENNQQTLLRTTGGSWELLDCNLELEDQYDELEKLDEMTICTTKPVHNLCLDYIFTTEYDKILANCNFTNKIEPRAITRTKNGILLMGNDLITRELSGLTRQTKMVFPPKYPVHIVTNDDISVTYGEKEILLKPVMKVPTRKVTYTYLSDDFISKMKNSAAQRDVIEDIEIQHIVGISFMVVIIILIPIVLTLCIIDLKRSRKCLNWCKKNRKNMQEAAQNLAENRQMLKQKRNRNRSRSRV